jgi:hypothetical protein
MPPPRGPSRLPPPPARAAAEVTLHARKARCIRGVHGNTTNLQHYGFIGVVAGPTHETHHKPGHAAAHHTLPITMRVALGSQLAQHLPCKHGRSIS